MPKIKRNKHGEFKKVVLSADEANEFEGNGTNIIAAIVTGPTGYEFGEPILFTDTDSVMELEEAGFVSMGYEDVEDCYSKGIRIFVYEGR